MPDAASIAEQRVVEAHLRQLRSLDRLRRLLADLNYGVGDEPVSVVDWKPELAKTAKDGNLRTVARHEDFVVTHCRLPELRVGTEREIVTRLVRQYDRGLFAFSNFEESHWHLVNVKRNSRQHNRLILRRIAIGPEEQLRTAIERISLLKVKEASWPGLEVELKHEEAFDVEKVTDQFYWDYKDIFNHISNRLEQQVNHRTARAFAQQFLNRMMFLYFLQKKGWLDNNPRFVPWLWEKYQQDSVTDGSFYKRYLEPLFFLAFRSPSDPLVQSVERQQLYAWQGIPEEIREVYLHLPYLNGDLFLRLEDIDDQGLEILDSEFENLFENLLEHYNFTVSEDTPLDIEVAVNPEMLGKVYENLVLEEERGQAGIFYTPRVELDFMCRRALIEYLDEEPIVDRPDLIRLVMNADTPEFVPQFPPERLREIRRRLEDVTVVDPACGSGAFLVGMMHVLSGLHRLICDRLGDTYRDFEVKKRIIGENLFGVDIKDWAVRVAELRLWLSLIIHASLEEVQKDPEKAILPNLTFRIQVGDSLVEEIAGRSLSLRGRYGQMSAEVRRQVNRLLDRKMDYYYNRGEVMPSQEIRRLEADVFRVILDDELSQIDRELRRLRAQEQEGFQRELDIIRTGGPGQAELTEASPEKAQLRRRIEGLERERAEITSIRESPDIERGKGPFLWDIEFAEVFQRKGGFDIVIGNPPYVRQEDIAPLNKDPQNYTASQWLDERRKYKEALQRSVQTHWGADTKIGGRADYYVYFYLHGLALLRERGTFCFITSNSWLDVGYGADLKRFLLTHIEIKDIYDNHTKRSFASSDINTVIVAFQRPSAGADLSSHIARFVAFKRPFEEVLTAENLTLIEWADSAQMTTDLRVFPIPHSKLWQSGLASSDDGKVTLDLGFGYGQYSGDKWGGKYLRAPDIFLRLWEKCESLLVPLPRLVHKDYGIKPGCVDFFYVSPDTQTNFGIEDEFLVPIINSSRHIDSVYFYPNAKLFYCHEPKSKLVGTGALRYIEWGEEKGYHRISSVRSHRPYWYSLIGEPVDFLLLQFWDKRFWTPVARVYPTFCSNNFFYGRCLEDRDNILMQMNSSWYFMQMELFGRVNQGQGVLTTYGPDFDAVKLITTSAFTPEQVQRGRQLLDQIGERQVRPIWEEVEKADRKALDDLVFDVLGLSKTERAEFHHELVQLVRSRLEKAASFSRTS
ncbi:Eco57I restriction-modification methylase domain-containing protein [Dehalococcoidia bacterium]|nr:Eco57I restriction-modification methylase domain-containing protein [Dehalococcoidia bacterium]